MTYDEAGGMMDWIDDYLANNMEAVVENYEEQIRAILAKRDAKAMEGCEDGCGLGD